MIRINATWWAPCYSTIEVFDEIIEEWQDDNRVVLINNIDDIGQPYTCQMWGDSHEAENPIIINGQSCANCENSYPMMYWFGDNYTDLVFIDHNMVFNYFNSYTVFYMANVVIQNMLDALPDSGDLNDDGIINILDIILIINMILDSNYNHLADINQDGIVDILDIVQIVNYILDN